jgi:hypothetical protein
MLLHVLGNPCMASLHIKSALTHRAPRPTPGQGRVKVDLKYTAPASVYRSELAIRIFPYFLAAHSPLESQA